ncbi:hypothetical protein [Streptomyces xiamenensis]|uniref:hypothetical protein n=1 Tax=Streptomyces xiamenensis TaxID=408015 RepID=UPI003D71B20A
MLYLVVLYNDTSEAIQFRNMENSNDNQTVQPYSMFRTQVRFDIPDCSAEKYFAGHHMEITDSQGEVLFSFWGDDHKNYDLYYCPKMDYSSRAKMPGGAEQGGNHRNVGIVLSGNSDNRTILGRPVQNNV